MEYLERLLSIVPGFAITVFIVLANYYQFKIRQRFSGLIGKVMFWHSLGLGALLLLTVWHWVVAIFDMTMSNLLWGDELLFLVACFFFFMSSIVIR
jgi:hypothetical protein